MTYRDDAYRVVEDAVKAIGDLASKALKAGDYGAAADIARMLEAVSAATTRDLSPTAPSEPRRASEPPKSSAATPRRGNGRSKGSSAAKRKTPTRKYPKFERDGDKLVKVGWSKKANDEYEHRAPRAAALAFVEHLASRTSVREIFEIEPLLPVPDGRGGELPSYQVYLALAWLRHAGAVQKKGRDGYVRASDPLDGSVFDTMWAQIPERS
jgi:hypothetical protein